MPYDWCKCVCVYRTLTLCFRAADAVENSEDCLLYSGFSQIHNIDKYQGVKEFHMLARIVVIVKLWLSVHLNLKPHIITHPMVTNDKTCSILKKTLKHFVKMV